MIAFYDCINTNLIIIWWLFDYRLRLGRGQFRRPTRQYYWRVLGSIFNFRHKNKRRFHLESPLIFRAEDGTWTHTPIIGTRSLVLLVCQFRHFRIFNYRRSKITKLSVLPRGKKLRCRRWDLNPHDIAATGTWSLRVCQFRHSCAFAISCEQIILY